MNPNYRGYAMYQEVQCLQNNLEAKFEADRTKLNEAAWSFIDWASENHPDIIMKWSRLQHPGFWSEQASFSTVNPGIAGVPAPKQSSKPDAAPHDREVQ